MAYPENTVNSTGIKYIWDKITALLSGKVDKVTGKGLSTNDYTTEEKSKLAGIESGAQVNPTIDSALSGSSTNAVQNKVVKSALDGKADTSEVEETDTPDTTPFLYRQTPYNADRVFLDELVGGSVAWNQLLPDYKGNSWNVFRGTKTISGDEVTVTSNSNDGYTNFYYEQFNKVNGHKYLLSLSYKASRVIEYQIRFGDQYVYHTPSAANTYQYIGVVISVTSSATNQTVTLPYSSGTKSGDTLTYKNVYIIDLTQMFGTTIADYIYSLEQATAGSGIAWLKSHGFFTKDYYPYNTGELISVKTSGKKYVGKNKLPMTVDGIKAANTSGSWSGNIYTINNGTFTILTDNYGNVTGIKANGNFNDTSLLNLGTMPVSSATQFICNGCPNGGSTTTFSIQVLSGSTVTDVDNGSGVTFTASEDKSARIVVRSGYNASNLIFYPMIRLSTVTDTTFEPHTERTYDISNIDLRGIPKLVNNELVYDGDTYESNGDVTRKYGIVDLGTLNWSYASGNNSRMETSFSIMKNDDSTGDEAVNAICPKYTTVGSNALYNHVSDKVIAHHKNLGRLWVYDSAYSDATTFKTAMSGVYLIYELATPTTETTDPYTNPQICDKDGTEEFIDDRTVPVPVGHNSTYADLPAIMDGDFLNYMADNFASEDYVDRAVEAVESLIPQKTVLYDDAIDVGDDFSISIPSSFNYLIFELSVFGGSFVGNGSLLVTSFDNGDVIRITAVGSSDSRLCELNRSQNKIYVAGDFMSEHGELKITAF